MPGWAAQGLTFAFVTLAWVLFRADSLGDALTLYHTLFGLDGVVLPPAYGGVFAGLLGIAYRGGLFSGLEWIPLVVLTVAVLTQPNVHDLADRLQPTRVQAFGLAALSLLVAFNLGGTVSFRYWAF
jgi:hypothetical protein